MDQLKTYLNGLRTYHFWILTVIVLIAGIATWSMASSDLAQQFEGNRGTIKTRHGQLKNVRDTELHPNLEIVEARNAQRKKLAVELAKIWQHLYEEQREGVLVWPEGLLPSFHQEVGSKQFGDPITPQNCNLYLDSIRQRFLALTEIVDAKPTERSTFRGNLDGVVGGAAPPGARRPDEELEEDEHTVVWPDQALLLERLASRGKLAPLEVWVMQEDFWAYETMLQIIARMNEGATGPHNARVREILAIEVGSTAAANIRSTNRVQRFGGNVVDTKSTRKRGKFKRSNKVTQEQQQWADLELLEQTLLNNRYVDESNTALGTLELKKAKSQEFKRLPVRMELTMDQRDIPRLLIECANAKLPIEVRQVRINANNHNLDAEPRSDQVIVQGIIYLFNPPDYKALGVDPPAEASPPAEPSPTA